MGAKNIARRVTEAPIRISNGSFLGLISFPIYVECPYQTSQVAARLKLYWES